MKLLFLTRTIDLAHPIAGFAASWVREFGNQLFVNRGQLSVLCWQEGNDEGLPDKVAVHSAGRTGRIRHRRPIRLLRFVWLLARLVPRIDAIFVHQHPLYAILAAPFAKVFRKKIFLWYVHKHVDFKLKLAAAVCDGIFTASKESFRLKTKKPVHMVGHGIDTEIFRPAVTSHEDSKCTILSVGRISPVKGYEVLIDAIRQLTIQPHHPITIRIVGGAGLSAHEQYVQHLKELVKEKGLENIMVFTGPKAHNDIIGEYQQADVFVNLSDTGSLDKAVLEAMACGVPVITSNEAFRDMLSAIGDHLFVAKTPEAVAGAIVWIQRMPVEVRRQLGETLRAVVVRDHNLPRCISKILTTMEHAV